MLLLNHCSNPSCHKPYYSPTGRDLKEYREAVALIRYATQRTERRVFSLCARCYGLLDEQIVKAAIHDVLEEEINLLAKNVAMTTKEQSKAAEQFLSYTILRYGRTADDL